MVPIIVLLCVAALLVFLVVMTYRGNGMARYALKRILLLIPTVLLVCVIVFILLRAVPTSAVDYMIYQFQTAGITVDAAQVEHMLGMDKPALIQFFDWFFGIFRGSIAGDVNFAIFFFTACYGFSGARGKNHIIRCGICYRIL